jgi:protein-disulfide isomerase
LSPTLFALAVLAAPPAPACPASPPVADNTVVGRVLGKTITVADLDREIAQELCGAQLEYRQKLHGLRGAALERLVNIPLLEAEAKRRGLPDTQALMQAVAKDVPEPTEAAVRAFYEEKKANMQGRSFEEVRDPIEEHLQEQAAEAHATAFVKQLRVTAKATADLPPIRIQVQAIGASRGSAKAPITIVEFADYQCPYCARGASTVTALLKRFPGQIRHVFRDYPLGFHDRAVPAALAARCAGVQGKYWEMHDALFANVEALDEAALEARAKALKLDVKAFNACRVLEEHAQAVGTDFLAGQKAGVNGTPAYFVNGVLLTGAQPEEAFLQVIEPELARLAKKK